MRLIPFPVNPKAYFADEDARTRWRRKLGVKEGELLITCAGRISTQKNCLRALDEGLDFAERSGQRVRIAFAGDFDDVGAAFFGILPKRGTSRKQWKRHLSGLSREQRRQVSYLRFLEPRELRSFYNAGDIFLSLSLYHDEDFGMAPIEALFCGSACVLTAWGGYRSFSDRRTSACQLVPVRLTSEGLRVDSKQIQHALAKAAALNPGKSERKARAQVYQSRFSIRAISRHIKLLHSGNLQVFRGFNGLLHRHAEALRHPPIFPKGPTNGGLYEEIYGAYLRG